MHSSSISKETKTKFEMLLKRTLESQSGYKKFSSSFQNDDINSPNNEHGKEILTNAIMKPPVPLPRSRKSRTIEDDNPQYINEQHSKLKADSDNSSESSFHSSGTYNVSLKHSKKSPLENEMDKVLQMKPGSSSSSTNSRNKHARHARHKRKIQRDTRIEIDTETYSSVNSELSEIDGYVTINIEDDNETDKRQQKRDSKLMRLRQKRIDDDDVVTETVDNKYTKEETEIENNVKNTISNNIVLVSSKQHQDNLIENKSHLSSVSDDDDEDLIFFSSTNNNQTNSNDTNISSNAIQKNATGPVKSERKKWNKSDTIIFMPSKISMDKNDKKMLSEVVYDSYEEDVDQNELSSELDTSFKQNINKQQLTSTTVGDIIVHSSPSNSSSTSIAVVEKINNIRELSSDEKTNSNTDDENNDNEDVYIPKILEQKNPNNQETTVENLPTKVYGPSGVSSCTDNQDSTQENIKSDSDSEQSTETCEKGDNNSLRSKESTENSEQISHSSKTPIYKYENIIGVTIHKMDNILRNSLTLHPLVKVYVIDTETGNYLKKSDAKRSVSYYYENQAIDYVTPIMTHQFNLIEKHALYPQWEETLIFNEDFEYLINNDKKVIFFEILDFVTFSLASSRYKKSGVNGGWYKIAWAFLKPVGKDGFLNVEKQLRLQLYKPLKINSLTSANQCDAYQFWLSKKYEKYPATLYVTVKRIVPSAMSCRRVLRSQNPIESEYETLSLNSLTTRKTEEKEMTNVDKEFNLKLQNDECLEMKWSRLSSQTCKVPNSLLYKLKMAGKGSFVVKFSNNGYFVACTTTDVNMESFGIAIFKVLTGENYHTMSGHNGIIYALCWSKSDQYLLSASSDCTVYIWDINNKFQLPVHMLPHPAYVYCAIFHPTNTEQLVIVSGCYDSVIRIWKQNLTKHSQKLSFDLYDELENHDGYITSLCFDSNGKNLFSADSVGLVIKWTVNNENYTFEREYKIRELHNQIINCVICHPGNQRLFIYGRDGILRMIDVATGCIMQWFKGTPLHVQTYCCLSPCGSLIFTPNTNCTVNVWNADTGHQEAVYNLKQVYLTDSFVIHCIDYHPKEHMIAMCHYGHYSPTLIFHYDHCVTELNNNIVNIVRKYSKMSENEQIKEQKELNVRKNIAQKTSEKRTLTLKNVIDKMDEIIQPLKNNKIVD